MKINKLACLSLLLTSTLVGTSLTRVFAGNGDRASQAGSTDLLFNNWAASSGWGASNTGAARGVESIFLNIAGTAFTKNLEVAVSSAQLFKGADINMNSFGLVKKVGESGALSLSVNSLDLGKFDITTVSNPDGNLGSFSPSATHISIGYAKEFSHSIYGGFNLKALSQSTPDLTAQGIAVDAGIQYVAGKSDNVKFGITLKNVGPTMTFSGDGLAQKLVSTGNGVTRTYSSRTNSYELPALLTIGAAYDFKFDETNRLTVASTFFSNSFTNDQFAFGLEYGFKTYLSARVGYVYSKKDPIYDTPTSFINPISGGFSLELPLGKSGMAFGLDYSYRPVDNFQAIQTLGAHFRM